MNSENGNAKVRERIAQLVGNEDPFPWAKRHGIAPATWDRLWNQGVVPKADTLVKLARAGNVTVDWLLTGREGAAVTTPLHQELARIEAELKRAEGAAADMLGRFVVMLRYAIAEAEGSPISKELRDARNAAVHGPAALRGEAQVNYSALAGAIAAVEDLLAERKATLAPDKKAKLVSLVYNQLTRENSGGQIERGLIDDLLDLAS